MDTLSPETQVTEPNSQLLIYQSPDGVIKIDVRLEKETVWLTQKLMAELFQTSVPNINMHLKSIYEEGELEEGATIKDFLIVQKEGNRDINRTQKFYNLDAIISVGYRIKSQVATQFRIWATQRLKEYIVKGFTLNTERFKSGNSMNYFNELQERIREIRLSERFFYQKIKDIYATGIDYDPKDEKTVEFFKIIQNKL
ncbi:MAG: cell filamentation protein Fic, partial [Desulfobacteraceae bacterium A6]